MVAVNREKLVGKYIGHTAPKTKECIEAAVGGEAIAVILEEMEEIALALYKQKERNIQPEALELLFQEFTYQWATGNVIYFV